MDCLAGELTDASFHTQQQTVLVLLLLLLAIAICYRLLCARTETSGQDRHAINDAKCMHCWLLLPLLLRLGADCA
uniref:Putative cysteine-rich protease inhibitor n=1 Tax=Anopheles darlingi TaxID=43151 RepID=A0A2M4D6I1_ANODA